MIRYRYNRTGEVLIQRSQDQPVCGEDFCDRCGDCLYCYSEGPCLDGKSHRWVVYEDDLDEEAGQ